MIYINDKQKSCWETGDITQDLWDKNTRKDNAQMQTPDFTRLHIYIYIYIVILAQSTNLSI